MTDTEIIIEVAKLDGWLNKPPVNYESKHPLAWWFHPSLHAEANERGIGYPNSAEILPTYLTSRDAIVLVIEKVWRSLLNGNEPTLESEGFLVTFGELCEQLCHDEVSWSITPVYRFVLMKPRQLCIALLKATGKWREEQPIKRSKK